MADDSFPAWTLVQAAHVVARGFTQVFATVGLTPSQFGVLAELADDVPPGERGTGPYGGLTQAELARRVLMRPQSMGELVGSLLERGLVSREGPGGRGRPTRIVVTDEGRRVLAEVMPAVLAFNSPASLGLSREQLDTLEDLLRAVLRTLGRLPERGE